MKGFIRQIPKQGMTPLKLEHLLIFILGVALIIFAGDIYKHLGSIVKVIILIVYLGLLVGIAPVPLPVFKSKVKQVLFAGLLSSVLDSFIVLSQCKRLRIVKIDNGGDCKNDGCSNEYLTEKAREKFLAILTIAALIGGLIIWFGEVFAASLYLNDGRENIASAFYIIPPVLLFLFILGWYAERYLVLKILPNISSVSIRRDLIEFIIGIGALLLTHNPLFCLGWLLVYAVIIRQDDHLLDIIRNHMEVNIILVLFIALTAGDWVAEIITRFDLHQGEFLPIIPAAVQAVLWGPLYQDQSVHFWIRIATLSTGALLLPISSLVGIMLFKTRKQWLIYMSYSFPCALMWYLIMRLWIWLTLETPVGVFLEQWARGS